MTTPVPKVEIGFDLTDSDVGPYFRLDDPAAGVLDNEQYTLGGTIFVDITNRCRSIRIQRGRSRNFANYTAGALSVELNNQDRAFDPLYEDSPYYGNIVPRKQIRVSIEDELQFFGWVDDWDLTYTPDGNSLASVIAYDAFSVLAKQAIPNQTPPQEKTGERIDRVLSDSTINWATESRQIDTGEATVGALEIAEATNALSYIQSVSTAEPGELFIGKNGDVVFKSRATAPASSGVVLFGEGGITFANVRVIYGTEELYNNIIVSRVDGGTAIASDESSQAIYGIRTLDNTGLLLSSDEQVAERASVFMNWYSQPEYRFESIEVRLDNKSEGEQADVLAIELGDYVRVLFTPNGIGDPIDRYLKVIRIEQTLTPDAAFVTFGFEAVLTTGFILDDLVFGMLDESKLGF